jgi:hypothetical protein
LGIDEELGGGCSAKGSKLSSDSTEESPCVCDFIRSTISCSAFDVKKLSDVELVVDSLEEEELLLLEEFERLGLLD